MIETTTPYHKPLISRVFFKPIHIPLQIYHEFVNPPNVFFKLIYIALGQKQGALDNFLLTIYKKNEVKIQVGK